MSMSIALSPYALITFWYAPASSPALAQELSSLLPLAAAEGRDDVAAGGRGRC